MPNSVMRIDTAAIGSAISTAASIAERRRLRARGNVITAKRARMSGSATIRMNPDTIR